MRRQFVFMLYPLASSAPGLDFRGAKDGIGEVGLKRSGEVTVVLSLNPERASVLLFLDIYPPI